MSNGYPKSIPMPSPAAAQQKNFNAIIEGSYQDDPGFHFKLAQLEIPAGTTVIHDGSYTYNYYEPDSDFQPVPKTKGKRGKKKTPPREEGKDLEAMVETLSLCAGPVLGERDCFTDSLLERPRTICFRDGRMYVDQEYAAIPKYMALLPRVLSAAWKIFNDEKYERFYEQRGRLAGERGGSLR